MIRCPRPWLLAVALVAAGCAGASEADEPGSQAAVGAPDAPVNGARVDLSPIPGAGCVITGLEVDKGHLEAAPVETASQPIVGGGSVFVHKRETGGGNAPSDLEVWQLAPGQVEPTQVTANDVEDVLLDAEGAARLIHRRDVQASASELVYVDDSGFEVVLWEGSVNAVVATDSWTGAMVQLVEPGAAAFTADGTVHRWDLGGEPVELWSGKFPSAAWLAGERVAWAGQDGDDLDVFLADADGVRALTTDDDRSDRQPVIGDDAVFWLRDGAMVRFDLETEALTELHEGSCSSARVDGATALFRCVGPETDLGVASGVFGGHLWYFDGQATHPVPPEDELVGPHALHDGVATWIAYPSADVGCGAGGAGTVRSWPLGADAVTPVTVALVTVGCWCCGAFHPGPRLDAAGLLVAWNYHADDIGNVVTGFGSDGTTGWATVTPTVACDDEGSP